jgi:Holliday junction resolvasome RuvABC DNA-binding subunit
MSGGADSHKLEDIIEDPEVEKVMQRFNVNAKTAEEIILYALEKGQELFQKWHSNTLRRVDEELKLMKKQYEEALSKKE